MLFATGRRPCTSGIGLERAGVRVDGDGFVVTDALDRTSAAHIFAIGDVAAGRPQLTPVAIQAGQLLARRLFGGAGQAMHYSLAPTTVFTPLEYGCCGYAEEAAVEEFGEAAVEVRVPRAVHCSLLYARKGLPVQGPCRAQDRDVVERLTTNEEGGYAPGPPPPGTRISWLRALEKGGGYGQRWLTSRGQCRGPFEGQTFQRSIGVCNVTNAEGTAVAAYPRRYGIPLPRWVPKAGQETNRRHRDRYRCPHRHAPHRIGGRQSGEACSGGIVPVPSTSPLVSVPGGQGWWRGARAHSDQERPPPPAMAACHPPPPPWVSGSHPLPLL